MFESGDIVFVEDVPLKFVCERKEKGTYVVESFRNELFEFPINQVRKGSKIETLEYLNARIAHWQLMLKGATELVEEHSQHIERLNIKIKYCTEDLLPDVKAKYDATVVALKLIGKADVDKHELDMEHSNAKIELDNAIGKLNYCKEALEINQCCVEEYKRDIARSNKYLEIFNSYKEKVDGEKRL